VLGDFSSSLKIFFTSQSVAVEEIVLSFFVAKKVDKKI